MANVNFGYGTKANYDKLTTKEIVDGFFGNVIFSWTESSCHNNQICAILGSI